MADAEWRAARAGYRRIAVISGVGARDYYRRLGYEVAPGRGGYLIKDLPSPWLRPWYYFNYNFNYNYNYNYNHNHHCRESSSESSSSSSSSISTASASDPPHCGGRLSLDGWLAASWLWLCSSRSPGRSMSAAAAALLVAVLAVVVMAAMATR